MKLSSASIALVVAATGAPASVSAQAPYGELPLGLAADGAESAWAAFVEGAFPTWCIDEDETRLEEPETCEDGTKNGRYPPLYLTKWWGGEDPALGGYPTDVDTRYPFYYGSGFFGQACAGGNSHCSFDFDGGKNNCAKCGKIVTDDDDGPNGPGHVPPHIGLAALTRAYHESDIAIDSVKSWFDYSQNGCRVLPHVLLTMVRTYFPRDADGKSSYPPPFTTEGGPGDSSGGSHPYPLEYVNLVGESCMAEQTKFPSASCYETHSSVAGITDYPTYLKPGHGSPHYCSEGAMEADVNKDWCPYVFFGPKRGKYRHPHVAYAAVEVWLAHQALPEQCGETWDDNDGKDYPFTPSHSVAFPRMASVEGFEEDPKQPQLDDQGAFIWPGEEGTKRKAVPGVFVIDKYLTPTTIGVPISSDASSINNATTSGDDSDNEIDSADIAASKQGEDGKTTEASAGLVASYASTAALVWIGASLVLI